MKIPIITFFFATFIFLLTHLLGMYDYPWYPQDVTVTYPRTSELLVEAQIRRIWGKDAQMALAVSKAENGTRECDRVSVTGDVGIFQINEYWHGHRGNLYDCLENIKIARQIYLEQGNWSAWTVYNTGKYKEYL